MTTNSNKKVILTSILALILCLSLIVGSTFALFTSNDKVNIAVGSGNVEVEATIENLVVYSPSAINDDADKTISDKTNAVLDNMTFANGGTAVLEGSTLKLTNMTPGDKVSFNIVVTNLSTVAIKYRTLIIVNSDNGFFSALNVNVNNAPFTKSLQSEWKVLEAGSEAIVIPVEVELPTTASNSFKSKSAELVFSVSAVQGNTVTENDNDENTLYLYSATDLFAFAQSVNEGNSYAGKTVALCNDIDLAGYEWTPIGDSETGNRFSGTFDGRGHTISNMTITKHENYGVGFIEDMTSGSVKNITFVNANVGTKNSGNIYGIVVGYSYGNATFENITIRDSKIMGYGKIGAILGAAADKNGTTTFTNCTVENTVVSGAYNCGGIAGLVQNKVDMSSITVDATWEKAMADDKYVNVDDTITVNGEVIPVKGIYWDYGYNYYLSGWADYYTDMYYSDIALDNSGYVLNEGLTHNK